MWRRGIKNIEEGNKIEKGEGVSKSNTRNFNLEFLLNQIR